MIFFLVVAAIFSTASLVAAHYILAVPERQATRALGHRMRELKAHARGRMRSSPELLRRGYRGAFPPSWETWWPGWECCAACRN